MHRALRLALTASLTITALLWPFAPKADAGGGLFISSYWLVSWRHVSPDVVEYTYRATLTNLGDAVAGASARAVSATDALTLVDASLTFGPVGRYRTVFSTDTFTVLHDCTKRLDWPFLRWTITPQTGTNQPPVADAGDDLIRRVTETAQLDGTRSSDPEGAPLSYRWTLSERPAGSGAALSDSTSPQPTFVVDRPGRYTAQLIVHDGAADSLPDVVSVTTENTPPVAVAGPDQTAPVGRIVTLDGSASSDADGDPLTFAWRLVSAPAGSAALLSDPAAVNPTLTIDRTGAYTVQLVVHDGSAASAPDQVVISTENSAPVADAGPDQSTTVNSTVTLDGSGSSDVDGDALSFAWTFVTRPPGSVAALTDAAAVAPSFVADVPGTFVLQLVASDGRLASAPDTVTITTENSPPIADAGDDQSVFVGAVATLNGSGSSDVDGDQLTYAWSLTTVPPGSAATLTDAASVMPSFTADQPGTYVAQLIVHDGQASSAPDTVTISTQNSPPVADAGADQSVISGQAVLLDGSASFDADGDPLSFQWSLTTRPAGSVATLSGGTTDRPTMIVDQPGTYIVQLVVHDGLSASAPDTVTVTTSNAAPVASAGPDQVGIAVGTEVTLDGSGSNDADGHVLTYQWVLLTRPLGSTAVLAAATSVSPTFTPDVAGDYVAQLIVYDGFLSSAPDTVLIQVAGPPPAVVTIEATDASASEQGDTGLFTITRDGSTTTALTVNYQVLGSAGNGTDYQALAPSVTIPAGASSATVVITPIDDTLVEQTERVELQLASGAGYTIGVPALGIVAIADNDLPIVSVSAADADAREAGPATGTFTFSRTGSTAADLLVSFSRGGTAVSINTGPQDYAAIGQAITIPAGSSEATVTITPLPDNLVEGAETVVLTIQPAPSYVVGTPSAATVTIADDPPIVRVEATDPAASEADAEPGTLTISRSGGNLAGELVVSAAIGGTAVNNTDYSLVSGLITLPAGQVSVPVPVTPIRDNRVEGAETVILTLQPGSGDPTYVIGSPESGTVTIADDPAVVNVAATDPDASEAGPDTGLFTFTRAGGNIAAPLQLLVTRSGTAANGTDYTSLGGGTFIVTIPANETFAVVTITPVPDALAEPPETVVLTINPNAAYVVGVSGTATVIIADGTQ